MRPWIRALLMSLIVTAVPLVVYFGQFGRMPPTRLNALFWVPPTGSSCPDRSVNLEDIPLLGEGVGLGEMCPESQYATGADLGALDGVLPWAILLVLSLSIPIGIADREVRSRAGARDDQM